MTVVEDDAGAARIMADAGYRTEPPFKGFVVIGDAGKPCGAVTLTRKSATEVELGALGHDMARKDLLKALFRYVFDTMGARRVSSLSWAASKRSARALRCLGFIEEGRKRQYGADGEDLILWGMLRHECRFL